jgi:hypothetical protein
MSVDEHSRPRSIRTASFSERARGAALRAIATGLGVVALLVSANCRGRRDAGTRETAVAAPGAPDAGEDLAEAGAAVELLRDAVAQDDAGGASEGADRPCTEYLAPSDGAVDCRPSTVDPRTCGRPVADGVPEELAVPPENREADARPGPESAERLARKLLVAIVADDASISAEAMFPLAPFEMLKDLPVPSAYHRRLVQWFEEDLHTRHGELGGATDLVFERFQFGRCTWQEPHTEGNLLPYWSCRRNRIVALRGTRVVEIEVRVIINWGAEWFVVHLGPVRQ